MPDLHHSEKSESILSIILIHLLAYMTFWAEGIMATALPTHATYILSQPCYSLETWIKPKISKCQTSQFLPHYLCEE